MYISDLSPKYNTSYREDPDWRVDKKTMNKNCEKLNKDSIRDIMEPCKVICIPKFEPTQDEVMFDDTKSKFAGV